MSNHHSLAPEAPLETAQRLSVRLCRPKIAKRLECGEFPRFHTPRASPERRHAPHPKRFATSETRPTVLIAATGFSRLAGCGLLFALAASLLSGCNGIPVKGEKEARQQAESVSAQYRPHGQKPSLPVLTTNSSLTDFVTYAMLNQPAVEAAYFDWLASVERITTARSLPDPQLTFQMDIQNIVTSVMPGVMMNFPGVGKLRAAGAVATAESQSKYFAFQTAVLRNAFEVKSAYYALYSLEEKIRVNQETLELLSELEKLARAQNDVGKVTLQDVLRAQIEQDRLKVDVANLEDSLGSARARFKAALGLGAGQPMPPLPAHAESSPLDLTSGKVFAAAVAQNTWLKGMQADLHAAEASMDVAKAARRPDTSVGLMADVKMNPVLYRPLGTVTIPLWRDKLAALLAEAQANKRGRQARLSAEEISLAVAIEEKLYLNREATRTFDLLQNQLLPKQRQSLEVARAGYLSGQIDFFNLTDAEQTLLKFSLDSVEASTQRELTLAELALIVQGLPPGGGFEASGPVGMNAGAAPAPKRISGGM